MENGENEVLEVIRCYGEGTFRADREMLQQAFAPDSKMYGFRGERYSVMDSSVFVDAVCGSPSMAEQNIDFHYEAEIRDISVMTATAVVREFNFYGSANFVDHFQVAKIDGVWKIVSKLYYSF